MRLENHVTDGERAKIVSWVAGRTDDSGADAWVRQVLGNFLARGEALDLPDRVAQEIGARGCGDAAEWRDLSDFLVRAVSVRRLPAVRACRMAVPDVVRGVELALRRSNAVVSRDVGRAVASARTAAAAGALRWRWEAPFADSVTANFAYGPLTFRVRFTHVGDGAWCQGWSSSNDTATALSRLRGITGQGSGLFPAIDAALAQITTDFIARARPMSLSVVGMDGKRNAWNATHYGAWAPDGYTLRVDRRPEGRRSGRAAPDGTEAVEFVAGDGVGIKYFDQAKFADAQLRVGAAPPREGFGMFFNDQQPPAELSPAPRC